MRPLWCGLFQDCHLTLDRTLRENQTPTHIPTYNEIGRILTGIVTFDGFVLTGAGTPCAIPSLLEAP